MRRVSIAVFFVALLGASSAYAEEDEFAEMMNALGVEETQFVVAPRDEKPRTMPPADDPVRLPTTVDTSHRKDGRAYLDPFVGREIYPELSFRVATGFVRAKNANSGENNGNDGAMALTGRADVSLYFVDFRFALDSGRRANSGPFEVVFKAPLAFGHHRVAPLLVMNVPLGRGFGDAVVEAGVGYHYARRGLGLKLEVSAFDGAIDRTNDGRGGGKLGWNAQLSYLVLDHVGLLFEADGVTAISEQRSETPPAVGDTIVRLLPGARFFLGDDSGLELGVAALLTMVPDGYGVRRHQGVLLDIGYTFF